MEKTIYDFLKENKEFRIHRIPKGKKRYKCMTHGTYTISGAVFAYGIVNAIARKAIATVYAKTTIPFLHPSHGMYNSVLEDTISEALLKYCENLHYNMIKSLYSGANHGVYSIRCAHAHMELYASIYDADSVEYAENQTARLELSKKVSDDRQIGILRDIKKLLTPKQYRIFISEVKGYTTETAMRVSNCRTKNAYFCARVRAWEKLRENYTKQDILAAMQDINK